MVEGGLLLHLGDGLGDQGRQVRGVLLGLGPLCPGQDLLLDVELHRAADAVHAVVPLLVAQALEGDLDRLLLLLEQVVGTGEQVPKLAGFISGRSKSSSVEVN